MARCSRSLFCLPRLCQQTQSLPFASAPRCYTSLTSEGGPRISRIFTSERKKAEDPGARVLVRRQPTGKTASKNQSMPLPTAKTEDRGSSAKARNQWADKVVEALRSGKSLTDSGGELLLSPIVLRDACRCSQCIDPSTRQRNFSFADIPGNVGALQDETSQDGKFTIRWENDITGWSDHVSSFSLDDLVALARGRSMLPTPPFEPSQSWDTASIAKRLMTVSYADYMNDDANFLTTIHALNRDGLVFVKDVPSSAASVANIVDRIGPIRNSFYGSTWDVRSKPSAENVAYTDKDLGFHMDLLYMAEVPAYQFLHCIQNTCRGGESRFADTKRAREIMQADHPQHARALRRHNIRYQYHNGGHTYEHTWPVFGRQADRVYYSPPFAERYGNVQLQSHEDMQEFLLAVKLFAAILERPDVVYETKMEEGSCAIFKNTRVVHARNSFDVNSGQRWLRGAYLDRQPFFSTYHRLVRQMNAKS